MNWTRAFTARPYPPRESVGVVWRNLVGASRDNPTGLGFVPRRCLLNPIQPMLTIGFGGDVMSMFDRPLQIGRDTAGFFADCDRVLLNFEGVITDQRSVSPDQKHTLPILDALMGLAPPERLVLSLANNHTGDFGEDECRRCQAVLQGAGLTTFGLDDTPFIDLTDRLRVVTGTRWSNRGGHHLAWLNEPTRHCRPGALNVLYPHWGYELELYPRRKLVETMREWLRRFDAVVGHHAHTPQPIDVLPVEGVRRLAAYSLGDLCFGMAWSRLPILRYYAYGLVLKVTVGPLLDQPSRWGLGELSWSFVECRYKGRGQGFEVVLRDRIALFSRSAVLEGSVG